MRINADFVPTDEAVCSRKVAVTHALRSDLSGKVCLNFVLIILNIETANRGSVVTSRHGAIMLSRLAYGIVGIVVVALSFSATLFTLNLWSGYPLSDPISTASIPAAAPTAAAATAPGAGSETPFNALPKIETA